ncbi:serine hydrolase domain-containing protein [Actinoplanes solisilvae]|uniref:serine hydrolase domain-containing protein n=1 Tax=Actinoplanes solisilvae TaxID=2486853 RepID=UPI000FDBF910|nr:serine hydrolase domain-containing protein [Actinoplanes solisilvae]
MWLEKLLALTADRYDVTGAAVAIGHDDQLLEAATGVLNRETGVEATPDSVFQIGSVTKIWTAALVMQLVDEGLVDLDEPVRRYLPSFGVVDAAAAESVTVRQLLLHTGGFDGDLFEDTGRGDDALDRYVAYLHDHAHQIAAPGAMYSYCNSGYAVLGALVAKLRGGTWESVLRERLINPLGVRNMALFAEEAILFRVAAGHIRSQVARPWQLPHSNAPAGATPCAAPRELVRFGRLFLDGGVSTSGDRLLSAEAIAAMTAPQLTLPGVVERGGGHRGLGFELFDWDGAAAYGHNGGTIGQAALWRVVPAHKLVVAINATGADAPGFFDDLLDAIVRELTGLAVPPRPTPPSGPYAPGPAEFAGRYEYPMAAYDVIATRDGLEVTSTPLGHAAEWGDEAKTERYVALSGTTFITAEPENGSHSTFTVLEGGRFLYGGRLARRV